MKNIGVILCGCGVYDGSEIQEAVLTLLSIENAGARASCFAPDIEQLHVIDHRTGQVMAGQRRNVLTESARIARGKVADLKELDPETLDALIIPGGFGAAKNLCDYAVRGRELRVIDGLATVANAMHAAGKPIGFLCIAPVIAAKLFGQEGVELTIGNDPVTAADVTSLGARHLDRKAEEIVVSTSGRIISTPAYMLGPTIGHVARGIDLLVRKVLELC